MIKEQTFYIPGQPGLDASDTLHHVMDWRGINGIKKLM